MKRERLPRGQVRMQTVRADGTGAAHFYVPAGLARLISLDAVFRPELTEEGVLYRYVEGQEASPLPLWLIEGRAR